MYLKIEHQEIIDFIDTNIAILEIIVPLTIPIYELCHLTFKNYVNQYFRINTSKIFV